MAWDLGDPSHLFKILYSYLSKSKFIFRHRGVMAVQFEMPGGGPQVTNLVFFILFGQNQQLWCPLDSIIGCIEGSLYNKEVLHPVLSLPSPNIDTDMSRQCKI